MKIAKASEADIDVAFELANALEALASRWGGVMPEKIAQVRDEDEEESFSLDDREQCRRVCEYLIKLTDNASLFRVVFGMAALLDPRNKLVDPNGDTLEIHPDIQKLKTDHETLRDSVIKMLKCKGRYHTEQNTIALAKLVGIDLPATEQPCKHDWKSIDPEHLSGIIECQACGTRTISSPVKILLPSPREYELVQQLAEAYCEAIQPAIDAGVIEVMEE